jgi:transposase-like protein
MDSESSPRRKVRRTAEQIQQLVAQFHRSGQTIDQFARQQGVALSTVHRWLRMQRPSKAPRLIEVRRGPEPGYKRIGQLRLSKGLVLELEHGFEPKPIAQLVQLLEGR